MIVNILRALPVILPVSIATGAFYLLLPRLMLEPAEIASRGLAVAGLQRGLGFAAGSLVAGIVITAIYFWVSGRWPGMQAEIFFKLGILTFAVFTLLALVACPLMKMTGRIPVFALMNLIWAAAYGWYLPQILR